jgi:hypothetical protein
MKFLGGNILPVNRMQRVYANGSLIIEQIQKGDEGTLSCTAKGRQGQTSSGDIHLRVVGRCEDEDSLSFDEFVMNGMHSASPVN